MLFLTPPLKVGRSQSRYHAAFSNLREPPYCCLKRPQRTQATHRGHSPEFSQNKANELNRDLQASRILQEDDVKLFQTFTDSRAELFLRVLNSRTRHVTFVLDGVHGAHNLAAIVRSCDAWGVQDLHLITQKEKSGVKSGKGRKYASLIDRFENEKSVKNVSKNSHKWLTVKEHDGVESCIQELRRSGYKVLVSSLSPSAKPIQEVNVSAKCAFVFGNEQYGVSKEMEVQADDLFTIPMRGFVESMNVSVAVATTASLTVTRSQAIVPPSQYALSMDEKRQLAHIWLMNRFSAKGTSKAHPTSQDVTRLGSRCERRILENGMFEQTVAQIFDPLNPHTTTVRLCVDTGEQLATYVKRRKFGALGDGAFEKRCGTITYCLAGAHTLSCGAALARYDSCQVSKSKLFRYFNKICGRITDLYAPYFDSAGRPVLPTFAPESQQTFDRLSTLATHEALPVCVELAHELFDIDASAVQAIIVRASYQDLSKCVTDTMRLSDDMSEVFHAEIMRSLPQLPHLMQVLQERESVRTLSNNFNDKTISGTQHADVLRKEWLAVLQVFLRICHAAFLSSEIHQAVWDRSTTRRHLARVHSLRFGLLESILCEAWAECMTVPSLSNMGPLRLVAEWDQALVALKVALRSREISDTNTYLFQETAHRMNAVTETAIPWG